MQPLTFPSRPTEAPLFFVLCDYGSIGAEWRGVSNYDELIADAISGELTNPTRFLEAIPDEFWSCDITAKVCQEIADRTAAKGDKLDPDTQRHLLTLIGQHCGVRLANALEAA